MIIDAPPKVHGTNLERELEARGFTDVHVSVIANDDGTPLRLNIVGKTSEGKDIGTSQTAVETVVAAHTGEVSPEESESIAAETTATAAESTLANYFKKGHQNLTASERADLPRLLLEVIGGRRVSSNFPTRP